MPVEGQVSFFVFGHDDKVYYLQTSCKPENLVRQIEKSSIRTPTMIAPKRPYPPKSSLYSIIVKLVVKERMRIMLNNSIVKAEVLR